MPVNLAIIGKPYPPVRVAYDWKDCVLYALGVGATEEELDFLYEGRGPKVLPTFAVVPCYRAIRPPVADLGIDYSKVVHGEQRIVLHRPIPPRAELQITAEVTAIYDKGSGAVAVIEARARDEAGADLFAGTTSLFCRGEGGFGGERGPKPEPLEPPDRAPDFAVTEPTERRQALLYRLSGDFNPLHADPEHARRVGFPRPILHGLCTFGFAGRAILREACGGEVARFRSFATRFAGVVLPGDRLTTAGWQVAPGRWLVRTMTQENQVVLANAVAEVVTAASAA